MAVWASNEFAGVCIRGRAGKRPFRSYFSKKSTACISGSTMQDRDLRTSLEAVGALQPAYEYSGELVDGRRRRPICAELGIRLDVRVCETLQEACSTLWALRHQTRAVELAKREGFTGVLELAQLCGTTPSAVAQLLKAAQPKKSHKRKIKEETSQLRASPRMLRRLVTLEPELYALAKAAAHELGHDSFPRLVRDALWKEVRDNVPGAPTHQPRRVQSPNGARRKAG